MFEIRSIFAQKIYLMMVMLMMRMMVMMVMMIAMMMMMIMHKKIYLMMVTTPLRIICSEGDMATLMPSSTTSTWGRGWAEAQHQHQSHCRERGHYHQPVSIGSYSAFNYTLNSGTRECMMSSKSSRLILMKLITALYTWLSQKL